MSTDKDRRMSPMTAQAIHRLLSGRGPSQSAKFLVTVRGGQIVCLEEVGKKLVNADDMQNDTREALGDVPMGDRFYTGE